MAVRSSLLTGVVLTGLMLGLAPAARAQGSGIREVTASDRAVIPLNTRLRYTTMIVLPDGEEILDVICGDRDFWVISAVQNVAHVKPAKASTETNLNLVTARGTIYSFLLSERSTGPGAQTAPDLKVYVMADPATPVGRQKYYSAADVERLQAELTEAREATTQAELRAREQVASAKQELPAQMQFPYAPVKYERPFLVRAMWHDGQFTYLQGGGMGSAAAAACLEGDVLHICHSGDVRCYLYSDGTLERLTDDHSVVASLVRAGILTAEAASTHQDRGRLEQAIGVPKGFNPALTRRRLESGDRVLLCSDGLWEPIGDDAIVEVLAADGSMRQLATVLADRANAAGGPDNITAVLYEHHDLA